MATTWDQALLCVYLPDMHAEDNYNANNADLQKKLTTMTLVRRYIAPWWHITILKLQALPSWLLETPMPVRGVIVGGWGSLGWKERGREGVMCKAWLGLKAPKIHPKSQNWTNQCVTKKEKFISPQTCPAAIHGTVSSDSTNIFSQKMSTLYVKFYTM